eukprot:gnl/TRDRNA2_/TRDRNA2_80400_c0_seq1.p1 gnl/TRDRNA2_/TRDRNA2_80400_c0~~gnl/TRDRNA2_/TRDRNA2_80400_c0_seq1.p1  ORF type:complete len:320 (+),score=39.13 gnl/TRDRNA2_/TRDRNA2_80400_c0_seq1:62-1021(+)
MGVLSAVRAAMGAKPSAGGSHHGGSVPLSPSRSSAAVATSVALSPSAARWAWRPTGHQVTDETPPPPAFMPPPPQRTPLGTPSTATPPTTAGGLVSGGRSGSSADVWETTSEAPPTTAGSSGSSGLEDGTGAAAAPRHPERRLAHARQRAEDSFEALRMELQCGSGQSRFASWPVGCSVRVSFPPDASTGGGRVEGASEGVTLIAKYLSHDTVQSTLDVELQDGSTRTVPANFVRRCRSDTGRRVSQRASGGASGAVPNYIAGVGALELPPHERRQRARMAESESVVTPTTIGRPAGQQPPVTGYERPLPRMPTPPLLV